MPDGPVNAIPAKRRKGQAAVLIAAYLALALWSTWPLGSQLTKSLPQGTEDFGTVPLFNLWTIWWNADRAAAGFRGYWDAPIFWPAPNAFAFSEPQIPSIVVAPLVWWSDARALAYNVYLLGSLTLNGWAAFRLFRRLEVNPPSAYCGGAMVLLIPFVHWQLGVLQLVPVYGIVWTIHALWNFGVGPTVRGGLLVGLSVAWTYLLCAYYGLFLILVLMVACPLLLGQNYWKWRSWMKLMPGATICLLSVSPVLIAQRAAIREPHFQRGAELIKALSAEPGDYTVPAWTEILRIPDRSNNERRPHWKLSPGNLKWLLAVAGVVTGVFDRRRRRWIAFCLVAGVVAFVCSQGIKFQVAGRVPYQWLIDFVPGMAHVRNVFRFGLLLQVCVVFAAVVGLESLSPARIVLLWKKLRRGSVVEQTGNAVAEGDRDPFRWFTVGSGATFLAGMLAAMEIRPPAQPLFELPSLPRNRSWIRWVSDETNPEDALACIPFPQGAGVGDYLDTTEWMYWQTFHQRRLANGYSGFFPAGYRDLREVLLDFPSPDTIVRLRGYGIRYCVVRREAASPEQIEVHTGAGAKLTWVFNDDAGSVDIYRIDP